MIRTNDWVYIHIPKTSGTNFIKVSEEKEKNLNNYFIKYNKYFSHQPLWWWENKGLVNKDDLVFSIVRNPYDRFVSFYNHIQNNLKVIDFEYFIKNNHIEKINYYVEKNSSEFANLLVWKCEWTQTQFLKSNFDKNVSVYKLEEDFKNLEQLVGYTFSDTFYNKRNHKEWRQYYNQYTLDAIYSIYKEDFLNFDYKREKI